MLTALAFLCINALGCVLSILRGPFWGLLVYANIYFNVPDPQMNWWASYLPNFRWSLTITAVIIISMILHQDKLSKHKLRNVYWLFVFYALTGIITYTVAVDIEDAINHSYLLFTFCVIVFVIIKSLSEKEKLRTFILVTIGLAGHLSLLAYTSGRRIHGRLENIGPADAHSSNEFGVLLAAIIPFLLPFFLRGKKWERIICLLVSPFILNAFILCNSRGAFVALVFGIIYSFILIANKKVRKYLIICSLCSIPVMLYLADDEFVQRLSSLWISDRSSELAVDTLSSGRTEIWRYGMTMVKDYPFGAGPNGFKKLARFYMPREILTFHPGAKYGVRGAHNSYLQVWVEQGYLGIIIFLLLCFHTMFLLYKSSKILKELSMSGTFCDLLVLSMNISFACSMFGGMFGAQVYYEFFWWQIALATVLYSFVLNIQNENHQDADQQITGKKMLGVS